MDNPPDPNPNLYMVFMENVKIEFPFKPMEELDVHVPTRKILVTCLPINLSRNSWQMLNSSNSSMQRRRVPRKIKEYGKTKISESTSNTASRSRPIPKENPNRL